jgi:hypothetical protein
MRIDRGVSRRSGQILVLAVWNMLMRAWVTVLFGQTKIDNVNDRLPLTQSNQKVIRLDIAMYKALGVHVFQTTQELIGQHQNRLELEAPSTIIKEIFQ